MPRNRSALFGLQIGAVAAALGLGCVGNASNARTYAPNRPTPANVSSPSARATANPPTNPQTYQEAANRPRLASNATTPTAGVQASDFRPLALSSQGDRHEAVAREHPMPSPPATVLRTDKPVLRTELRMGLTPKAPQPLSDAGFARPITDRSKYASCGLPEPTHVHVQATIYDGSAVSVGADSTPDNAALDQCVVNTVRGISWARDLNVRKVDVTF
jgi:hypothetical protein